MTASPTTPSSTTPGAAGFRMPPEWAPHARSWMAWPSRVSIWNGRMDEARRAYAEVARAIARFEPLVMLANEADAAAAEALCGKDVEIWPQPLDDSWIRDFGPTFVVNKVGALAGATWRFNAWGGKYPPWDRDAAVALAVLDRAGVPAFRAPFILEGGAIHVDGAGTVLTSEQCLLNPNRNPELSRDQIETNLLAWLGAECVIWLGQGLDNDDTDGHIDNLACFADEGLILAATCADPSDPDFAALADNRHRLGGARDAQGRSLEIVELPIPKGKTNADGRIACTYVNHYLCNGAVIAPAFDDAMDTVAARVLAEAYPGREVVQLPALAILEGGGGIHCITQQQPAGKPASIEL